MVWIIIDKVPLFLNPRSDHLRLLISVPLSKLRWCPDTAGSVFCYWLISQEKKKVDVCCCSLATSWPTLKMQSEIAIVLWVPSLPFTEWIWKWNSIYLLRLIEMPLLFPPSCFCSVATQLERAPFCTSQIHLIGPQILLREQHSVYLRRWPERGGGSHSCDPLYLSSRGRSSAAAHGPSATSPGSSVITEALFPQVSTYWKGT